MNIRRRNIAICILVSGLLISGCRPGQSFGPTRFVAIAAGGGHTCALTSAGGVKCWGNNEHGELGDGTNTQRLIPMDVVGLTSGAIAIAAGGEHSCALTSNGGVKCWGDNEYGQLGDGTTISWATPVDVSGLTSGVIAIAAGGEHSCVLTSVGGVKCWGRNENGELGFVWFGQQLKPADVIGLTSGVIGIAVGWGHACALISDGGVKCWGENRYGQLGDSKVASQLTPVDVNGLTSPVVSIAAGYSHTCVLTSGGGVKCWGYSFSGHADVIGLSSGVTAITAGDVHTCALTSGGRVKCWGMNHFGELGNVTLTQRLTQRLTPVDVIPVDVIGLSSGVSAIAAGSAHTCALTSNGRVKCWGDNKYGQLGDGTNIQRLSPDNITATATSIQPTATPNVIPTPAVGPTPIPYPTLIPTIEPAKVPGLLQSSLYIETLDPFGGHSLRRITSWKNGFNSGLWNNDYAGYQWMDANHLLLFPVVGETQYPDAKEINARPVVINLDIGKVWLPPLDPPETVYEASPILLPRWSPGLGVLITSENVGEGNAAKLGVTTYTSDGEPVARYLGKLVSVSPSGNKILNADDTWIDLSSGKTVRFTWGSGVYNERWTPIWSPDETRVYFCCYFYGNAKTGESYTISNENTIFDGHKWDGLNSFHNSDGIWLNDNYVMVQFDGEFIPIFDSSARTFRNLGKIAGLPDAVNHFQYTSLSISPNRDYMEISQGAQSPTDPQVYLVDLKTLKSQLYHAFGIDWSANGKYAIVGSQVLTLSSKTLRPLPKMPDSEKLNYGITGAWHPTAGALLSIDADKQKHQFLYLLDVESLTYRYLALPSNFNETYGDSTRIIWNSNGDHFVLAAADGSLWQLDYPKLEKLEQLTPPLADANEITWSPDGTHLSFVSGSDIYVVNARSNP